MDWETTIKIKSVNDASGAQAAKNDQKAIGDEAERTAARTAASNAKAGASFGLIKKGIAGVRHAMATLNAVLSGFGIIGIITTLVSWFKSLYEWMSKSTDEARRLREEANLAIVTKSVQEAEAGQRRFNDEIRTTLKLMDEENAKADAQTSRRRAVEDARLKLEEAQALSGVEDPSERRRIQNDYARRRAKTQIARASEDEQTAAARAAEKVNAQQRAVFKAQDQKRSIEGKIGGLDAILGLSKDDETREKIQDQRKKLEDMLGEAREEVERQKKLLERARAEQKAVAGMSEATVISAHAELQGIANAEADRKREVAARKAEEKRKADIAAAKEVAKAAEADSDRKTVAEGKVKMAELSSYASTEQARAQAAADAYTKEKGEVIAAQNRYDTLVVNGGSRKEKSAALAALQKEQAEAQEAQHEMERVAAQVAGTLQGINAQIKALASAVQKAENRLAQNQADAPEG